jgi:hypothetical protein
MFKFCRAWQALARVAGPQSGVQRAQQRALLSQLGSEVPSLTALRCAACLPSVVAGGVLPLGQVAAGPNLAQASSRISGSALRQFPRPQCRWDPSHWGRWSLATGSRGSPGPDCGLLTLTALELLTSRFSVCQAHDIGPGSSSRYHHVIIGGAGPRGIPEHPSPAKQRVGSTAARSGRELP